jgi:prophage regulatory protein
MRSISSDRLLTWPEVQARVGLSRSTVWRLESVGKFPPRLRISPGRVAWRENEIDDFVAGRWKPKTDTV